MRHIATLILTLLFCITAQAQNRTDALGCPIGSSRTSQATATSQNRIDEMVENLSTNGHTTFTSIVTLNKVTRKVEKVVKHADVMGNASKFISAFEEECKKHDSLEKIEGDTKTVNFTIESKTQQRIYIIQYPRRSRHHATVTIIVNYK
jgi:hypothetical protein